MGPSPAKPGAIGKFFLLLGWSSPERVMLSAMRSGSGDEEGFPFFAYGNSARGIIAVGNVAYGVIAIGGSLSVGVVSIGGNAVGTIAIGLNAVGPISISAINGVGVLTYAGVNGLGAFGAAGVNSGYTSALGFLFAVLAGVATFKAPNLGVERPPSPPLQQPELTPFEALRSGQVDEGWVRGSLSADCATVTIDVDGVERSFSWGHASDAALLGRAARSDVFARLEASRELVGAGADANYREAPETRVVLTCQEVRPVHVPARDLARIANRIQRGCLAIAAVLSLTAGIVELLS